MDKRYLKLPYFLYRKPLTLSYLPLHLQVEPTDACNQRCIMCYRDRLIKRPIQMGLRHFKQVIDDVRPSKLNISGLGEPMLNKEIFNMVRYAKSKNIGITFPTNFVLAKRYLDEIIYSGVDVLKISLDAAERETYKKIRGTDHFDQVIEAIHQVCHMKKEKQSKTPHIRINFALQKENINQLSDMVKMASELNAEAIYVQYLDYVDVDDLKDDLVAGLESEKLRDIFYKAKRLAQASGIVNNFDIWLRDLDTYMAKIQTMGKFQNDRKCHFPWISTFIEANGDVKACPIFTRMRGEAKLGNIFEQSFNDIWNGEAYKDIRRKLKAGERPYTPCRQCVPQSLRNILLIFSKLLPGW